MARRFATVLVAVAACSKQAGAPAEPEAQLATDLPAAVIDTALRTIAQTGGPRAVRIEGAGLGAAALADTAAGPQAGDVRWDAEPYGAIAAARRGELLPMPAAGNDVPPLWRDPGGTWVAVGGRAVVLLVASDLLKDHPTPVHYGVLTQPWLKGNVAI